MPVSSIPGSGTYAVFFLSIELKPEDAPRREERKLKPFEIFPVDFR